MKNSLFLSDLFFPFKIYYGGHISVLKYAFCYRIWNWIKSGELEIGIKLFMSPQLSYTAGNLF